MKDLESLDAAFVIDTFLLLLIGIGPKIALVPFLEATASMPEAVKRRVLRKMLTIAAIVRIGSGWTNMPDRSPRQRRTALNCNPAAKIKLVLRYRLWPARWSSRR